MAMKQKHERKNRPHLFSRRMTSIEFRAITFIATLVLAGIAIVLKVQEPVVWGFLGTAIGISLGQATQVSPNR